MDFSIILGLVQNLAILISFTLLYDLVWGRSEHFKTWFYKVFTWSRHRDYRDNCNVDSMGNDAWFGI